VGVGPAVGAGIGDGEGFGGLEHAAKASAINSVKARVAAIGRSYLREISQ
jgi:hypothetical protein